MSNVVRLAIDMKSYHLILRTHSFIFDGESLFCIAIKILEFGPQSPASSTTQSGILLKCLSLPSATLPIVTQLEVPLAHARYVVQ